MNLNHFLSYHLKFFLRKMTEKGPQVLINDFVSIL